MDAKIIFEIRSKQRSLTSTEFFTWFKKKFNATVATNNNTIIGELVYDGIPIKQQAKTEQELSEKLACGIIYHISSRNNFHIANSDISYLEVVRFDKNLAAFTLGKATMNAIFSPQLAIPYILTISICEHIGLSLLNILIPNPPPSDDKFISKCFSELSKSGVALYINDILYYFSFTNSTSTPVTVDGGDSKITLVPFNIYDFTETMSMMGYELSPNLNQYRNKELAYGHCYSIINNI